MKMMISKYFVPFGGVRGWLADLTLPAKGGRAMPKTGHLTASYYAAEPDERRARAAIRAHAGVGKDANLELRRALSRRELAILRMSPGQVRSA